MRITLTAMMVALAVASSSQAASITGVVSDSTGGVLPDTRVVLRQIATGQEQERTTASDGRYTFDSPDVGAYLVVVTRHGFAEAARTVIVDKPDARIDLPIALDLGSLSAEVTVTAARSERELRRVPLHIESITADAVQQMNAVSTGEALSSLANVTPVGNGPFGVRPRLRGLDSTRLLVLVDGERLNTARMATDRTGAEVGLVSADVIKRIEIVNGAGTLLYGSDALAGTINIVTNEPSFTETPQLQFGFRGLYSSSEDGRRGTLTTGFTSSRVAVRVQGGGERYRDYRAGALAVEDTTPLFTTGQLNRSDTIDDNFGFAFNAFPDPFNAPYVRTDNRVLNSRARGNFVNASALVRLGERRSLRLRLQRRRMTDIGFADFAQPYFFNATSLPFNNHDKVSARYEAQAVTPWLANLSLTAYYQRQERQLQNLLPVQFPAPTANAFFPISVMRLDILSRTDQRVWTPGVELQAVFVPSTNHLLTTGLTIYQDRSRDERTTETTTSLVGQVAMGPRGPAATVLPSPIVLGAPAIAHPVRVPDANFRDFALFAQHEWRVRPSLSIVAGLRGDFYAVDVHDTAGYDLAPVVANANPAIDPSTLPSGGAQSYTRQALTGDIGLVVNPGGRLNPFVRFGRSYRHPNLEEMLFAGPATTGSIAPNVNVKPEKGNNFDVGVKFRAGRLTGGAYGFLNHYEDFIAQDLVVASTPSGPLAQATNFANVRIGGVELAADAPINVARGVLTLTASAAFTHGTVTKGINPITRASLDGTPADNISPVKAIATARYTSGSGRWWAEYGVRGQQKVTRVADFVLDSPFLIAQDLLSLDGFVIHRLGAGLNIADQIGLVLGVENLADRYYREQFQFAPARGRSFTLGFTIGGF